MSPDEARKAKKLELLKAFFDVPPLANRELMAFMKADPEGYKELAEDVREYYMSQ